LSNFLAGFSIFGRIDKSSRKLHFTFSTLYKMNIMRFTILSILILVTITIQAQVVQPKFIEVTGFEEREILADYVEMSVSVKETDNLRKENDFAIKEKTVLEALSKLGIPQEDITVDNFNAYRFGMNNSSNRYSLSKTFLIKVRELKSVNDFIIKLYEAGASEVQVTKRVKTDLEKYKTAAVRAAVENAKIRATEIATTLNVTLGMPLQVTEIRDADLASFQNRYDYAYSFKNYQQSNATGAVQRGIDSSESENLPNVDIRKMKINYRVLIQFEIVNK
jgi:uncharacterized protein